MNIDELKIVLCKKDSIFTKYNTCIFLFLHDNMTEFVIADLIKEKAKVGQIVDSWDSSGQYFSRLEDALKNF